MSENETNTSSSMFETAVKIIHNGIIAGLASTFVIASVTRHGCTDGADVLPEGVHKAFCEMNGMKPR